MKNIFWAYVNAINKGDIEAVMQVIAPDAELLNSRYRPVVPAEGIELIRAYIMETVISQNGRITVLDIAENDNTIVAKIELRSDRITRAGFARILGTEKFSIQTEKIKGFEFSINLEDAESQQFFDFVRNLEANRPK